MTWAGSSLVLRRSWREKVRKAQEFGKGFSLVLEHCRLGHFLNFAGVYSAGYDSTNPTANRPKRPEKKIVKPKTRPALALALC